MVTMVTTCCSLFLLSLFAIGFGQFIFSENESLQKTCDNKYTFKQIFHLTLKECADECIRRQRCKATMFHDVMKFCALKEDVGTLELDKKGTLCRYIIFDNVLLEDKYFGPCSNHTCSMNERCTDKYKNEYECVKSECEAPTAIDNAYLLSNTHDIGTTNRYKCRKGYSGRGIPTITCDNEANWTATDFQCHKVCPSPKFTYFNGDLTEIEGDDWSIGTVLHFTCRDGYTSNGDTATSTCHTNAKWNPRDVRCCHDNSTNFVDGACMRPIGVDSASNVEEVKTHCDSLGGSWQWVRGNMTSLFTKKENVTSVLQKRGKKWYTNDWNYTACAVTNGAYGDANQHIDDMLKEVVSKSWTGRKCLVAYDWLPGQPDGGDLEECLFFYPDARKYYDDICDFDRQSVGFACGFAMPSV